MSQKGIYKKIGYKHLLPNEIEEIQIDYLCNIKKCCGFCEHFECFDDNYKSYCKINDINTKNINICNLFYNKKLFKKQIGFDFFTKNRRRSCKTCKFFSNEFCKHPDNILPFLVFVSEIYRCNRWEDVENE